MSEILNSSIANIAVNSNVRKELDKGGLRVKAGREQERFRSSVLLNEIKMLGSNLQEKCHGIVDIAGHWWQLTKVTEWQDPPGFVASRGAGRIASASFSDGVPGRTASRSRS